MSKIIEVVSFEEEGAVVIKRGTITDEEFSKYNLPACADGVIRVSNLLWKTAQDCVWKGVTWDE